MHVRHFMTEEPIACDVEDTAEDVARLMRDKNVGFVVVLEDGFVAGVVTDRDITVGVVAEGLHAAEVKARDVMMENPATLSLDDNVFSVLDTFRSAGVVRRAPVLNERRQLVGVVSVSDVAVVAKDLVDGLLLEDTHHALRETRVPTGGKKIQKAIRSPTEEAQEREPVPVTRSSVTSRQGGATRTAR